MALKFPSELAARGTVKVTDKLIIHNIDTGATEYTTVSLLLAALAAYGNVGIGTTSPAGPLHIKYDATTYDPLHFEDTRDGDDRKWRIGHGVGTVSGFGFYDETGTVTALFLKDGGGVRVPSIAEYNDNANAAASGLAVGDVYRTGDDLKIVHA